MSYTPAFVRHIPMRQHTLEQRFLLELDSYMDDLRRRVNELRTKPALIEWQRGHLQYLTGRIHGWIFGMYSTLAYRNSIDDFDIDYARTSAMAEADFLTCEYLYGTTP